MYEQRRRDVRAVPGQPVSGETVSETYEAEYWPVRSRISWGAILAGVFVAIAAELLLAALGGLIGLGATRVTSIIALRNVGVGLGIWTVISALVAMFIGGFVAARLAAAPFASDGLWHGLTVWAFVLVAGLVLGTLGVTGTLNFAGSAAAALRGLVPTAGGTTFTPAEIKAAADVAGATSGYFLLGSLLGLAASLFGGWLGSARMTHRAVMAAAPPAAAPKAAA